MQRYMTIELTLQTLSQPEQVVERLWGLMRLPIGQTEREEQKSDLRSKSMRKMAQPDIRDQVLHVKGALGDQGVDELEVGADSGHFERFEALASQGCRELGDTLPRGWGSRLPGFALGALL